MKKIVLAVALFAATMFASCGHNLNGAATDTDSVAVDSTAIDSVSSDSVSSDSVVCDHTK